MKRILYKDEFQEIREITRYRGRKGRFVTEKYAKRWLGKRYIKVEKEQWRLTAGVRPIRVQRVTPDVIEKRTYPGAVADNEGNIYATLEQTNVFTEISKVDRVLINIRGVDRDGNMVRLQSEKTIGRGHEDEQLMMAVKELMAGEGYRTNYNLSIVRIAKVRRESAKLEPLIDTEFTITLLR